MKVLMIAAFLAVLLVAAVSDYGTQTIYDSCHVIIFLLGAAALCLYPEHRLMDKCIGTLMISLPMFLLTIIIPGVFGGGDIKLMAAGGWFLGAKSVVLAFVIGVFAGGMYCAVMLAWKKIDRKEYVAFGPWLALGLAVAVFYEKSYF